MDYAIIHWHDQQKEHAHGTHTRQNQALSISAPALPDFTYQGIP